MPRPGNASAIVAMNTPSVAHDPAQTAAPANDGAAHTQEASVGKPRYVITAAIRKRLLTQAIAMSASEVAALPKYPGEHLDWVETVQQTAWSDREQISALVLRGKVVSVEDIDEMGYRVEFAREVFDAAVVTKVQEGVREATAVGAAAKGEVPVEQLSDEELRARMQSRRVTLCDALKRNLSAGSASMRAVTKIRADRRASSHAEHNRVMLAIFRDAELVKWLRSLPKGEGAALDDLRALEGERKRRAERPVSAVDSQGMPLDLAERAYCLATASLADVLNAGRYLIEGVASRKGDYAGFQPPRRMKKAVVAPDPAPAKPVTG